MTSPATTLPTAITTLTKRLAEGWTHHVTGPRTGSIVLGGLSETTDGEGRRHRVEREVSVTSYMLKGCHAATRRGIVAVWVRQDSTSSWKLDLAYRGRHEGEHAPQRLDAGQLAAYAGSTSVPDYQAQLELLAAKRDETRRKGAATRAARRAGATELSEYGTTEGERAA
jgi:hypothetical protein